MPYEAGFTKRQVNHAGMKSTEPQTNSESVSEITSSKLGD
jgi:hypothetical protein